MKVAGKCLCGAIQFFVDPKELHAHACHCSMCRRQCGSMTMTVNCQGPPEFEKGKDLVTTYKSSEYGDRSFCSICGSILFASAPSYNYFGVSTGVLDEAVQAKLILDSEIYTDTKPEYYSLTGEQKKFTEAEFLAMLAGMAEKEEES